MAINGINGSGFNPYGIGSRPAVNTPATTGATPTGASPSPTRATETPSNASETTTASSPQRSVADAIKNDAAARAAAVNSSQAPDGVDQDLWSVLSKEERSFFVKAGAMGPLTYGRFSSGQGPTQAPLVRGGRLDIKA